MQPNPQKLIFSKAVKRYWQVRKEQADSQEKRGISDTGTRSSVTGGKQMDGFSETIVNTLTSIGVRREDIFTSEKRELPGYFRPHKGWDILVVSNNKLLAGIELKSQVGPSFGNNFNNRTEEAIGSAEDFWTAYREGAYGASPQPWLGYLFLLEDCKETHKIRSVREPHFNVLEEYEKSSYSRRYELFCRKLVLERKYNSACLILSDPKKYLDEYNYKEPATDLSGNQFISQLTGQIKANLSNK